MQTSFFSMRSELKFGGILLIKKRKSARPLCAKRTIHLVMKASSKIRTKEAQIKSVVSKTSKKWGIKIYRMAVATDHVHMLIRIPTRQAYRFFIQSVTGTLTYKYKIKWLLRPFTRIVAWGTAFTRVAKYIEMNQLEAMGFIPYQPRGRARHNGRRKVSADPELS